MEAGLSGWEAALHISHAAEYRDLLTTGAATDCFAAYAKCASSNAKSGRGQGVRLRFQHIWLPDSKGSEHS